MMLQVKFPSKGEFMTEFEQRSDRFTAIEDRYAGYTVYDRDNDKIGKVDDLFLDESDQPEYIGVKMGFLGTKSTLLPMDLVTIDEERQTMTASVDKETAKSGPAFDDDHEITPEYEQEIHSYYGLEGGSTDSGSYGDYYGDEDYDEHSGAASTGSTTAGTVGPGMSMGDTESGEFREHDRNQEGVSQPGSDLEDEDELRVQRTEEELRAGTREREAGAMKVRKRVRTDRERIEVPTKREEVHVERVPVEEGVASEAEIGDDEIRVPVTEEEVIVDKKPVVKEELRIRKEVVEDTEVVEEDVRREEVDIEDETEKRNR